jgi:hypothetical protein
MGCRYCMVACRSRPTYEYDNAFTPQVRKCDFCFGRNALGELEVPACVHACPKECLTFGPRSDLLSRAREKIRQHPEIYTNQVYGEHEAGGTSWLYLSHVPFEKLGFPAMAGDGIPRLSESIQHGVFAYFVPPIAWCALLALTSWLTGPGADERRRHKRAQDATPEGHSP